MGDDPRPTEGKGSPGRLLVPSLVLSRGFVTQPPPIITSLLLIEIGLAFGYPVGVVGQIQTFSFIVSVIFALLMGILSVRFKHRSLLLMGLVFYIVSAVGCFLAPTFTVMLLAFSLSGAGYAIVTPMSSALVGKHLPIEKRSKVISWMTAGTASLYLVGFQVVDYIAGFGGWRMSFLGFMLPISLLSLTVAVIGIPSASTKPKPTIGGGDFFEGFKKVLSDKSAIACLVGTTLGYAMWQASMTYFASFLRQGFSIPTGTVTVIYSGIGMVYIVSSLLSGYLTNKFGRKNITVISTLLMGIFTFVYLNSDILSLSVASRYLVSVFGGMWTVASDSLALEQVQEFRGTMMSTKTATSRLGSVLGAGLGGLALLLFGYGGLGISFGVVGVVAAVIYHFLAVDPTRS